MHKSSCRMNDAPALRPGPCSCGAVRGLRRWFDWLVALIGWRDA